MIKRAVGDSNSQGLSEESSDSGNSNLSDMRFNHATSPNKEEWKQTNMAALSKMMPQNAQPAVNARMQSPVSRNQTNRSFWGAVDQSVGGGVVDGAGGAAGAVGTPGATVAQNTPPQVVQPPYQSVANPAASVDNQPAVKSGQVKENAMSQQKPAISEERKEFVRAVVKAAMCGAKHKKKKKLKKKGEQEIPGTSIGAPLGAAGIGAGGGAGLAALLRNIEKLPASAGRGYERATAGAGPTITKILNAIRTSGKAKGYGLPALGGAAAVGLPAWMGARSAKNKGGAGRGAATGAGIGAGVGAGLTGAIALLARKNPALAKKIFSLKGVGLGTAAGAATGAAAGMTGGGIQKRRRTKAQGGEKKEKSEGKGEKKEASAKFKMPSDAAFKKVASRHNMDPKMLKKAFIKKAFGWGAALGLPALALGAGAVLPPLYRGVRHRMEMAMNPLYAQQHQWQKMMYSPQMMSMMMMRNMFPNKYGGGQFGTPPPLSPEDQAMLSHGRYLQGLRSRAKTMRELFEA